MKKSLGALVLSAVTVTVLVRCATTPAPQATAEAKWINNMHHLSALHLKLIPLAADNQKFSDPKDRDVIRAQLKEFADTANDIAKDHKAPNADPIIKFNATELAEQVHQAYGAFQLGDLQWSRFALNRTTSYCIGCHTRADRGVKDFEIGWSSDFSNLTASQAVEFMLANRQYHSAVVNAMRLAGDQNVAKLDSSAWILAIERTLGMIVRVNKDPDQARVLVQTVAKNKAAPYYIRRDAADWLTDIKEWSHAKPVTRAEDKFKQVIALVDQSQKAGARSPRQLVRNLRASGLLHELLEDTKSPHYGESLLYAGMVADSLRDLNMGFLDQFYFESCIRAQPHTDLAERCYGRLDDSMRNSNPFYQIDAYGDAAKAARLAELRKLSQTVDVFDDPVWLNRNMSDEFIGH